VDFSTGVNTVDPATFRLTSLTGINTSFDRPFLQGMINNLLGRVGTMTQAFVAADNNTFAPPETYFKFDARFYEYDLYFQDTWKFRPNLTFDLGLRWEPKMSPRGGNGQSVIYVPDRPIRLGEAPANDIRWAPGKLYNDDWNNFGPAVGFAWDPFKTGKTSIRANYRLAFDRMATFLFSSAIFPTAPGLTYGVSNTSFGSAGGRVSQGLPQLAPPAGLTPQQLQQPPAFSTNALTVIDPSLRSPKVHEWGVSFQREVGFNSVLEVNYIGKKGIGLLGGYDINQVDIFNNGFLQAFNQVRAAYLANPACAPVQTSSCTIPANTSQFFNDLLSTATGSTGLRAGESGSQFLARQYGSSINLGSVAAVAAAIAQRINPGQTAPAFTLATNSATGQRFSPFLFQPYPQFSGAMYVIDTNDFSFYNSLQVIWRRRFTKGISYQLSYTLAKSMDTRSFDPTFTRVSRANLQSASSTPFNIYNRRLNYAPSDFDRRHALQGYFVYDLPLGKGHRFLNTNSNWLDRVIGGWEVAGGLTWLSGRPFTVYSGVNTVSNVNQSPANCNNCRPDMGNLVVDPVTGVLYFFNRDQIGQGFSSATLSSGQFSVPAPGELGNTGRNFFRGPAYFDIDMTFGKKFRFTERMNLELRLEAQNLTNHPSFDIPVATITSSSFGNIYNTFLNSSARRMQVALKFNF
jgi:hypothetical protein